MAVDKREKKKGANFVNFGGQGLTVALVGVLALSFLVYSSAWGVDADRIESVESCNARFDTNEGVIDRLLESELDESTIRGNRFDGVIGTFGSFDARFIRISGLGMFGDGSATCCCGGCDLAKNENVQLDVASCSTSQMK